MDSDTRDTQATEFKLVELDAYQARGKDDRNSKLTPALLGYDESRQDRSGISFLDNTKIISRLIIPLVTDVTILKFCRVFKLTELL